MTYFTNSDLDVFGLSIDELQSELAAQAVIFAAGGKIVGRIRLQKIIFLIDQLGFGSGFVYSYHHYGPYSEDLARAIDSAKIFRIIHETREHRASDGAAYSVFSANSAMDSQYLERIRNSDRIVGGLSVLNGHNSTVLELAATIYWIKNIEHNILWKNEVFSRKGPKTENGRFEKAERLLVELGMI
ncbi:hypothetical protein ACFQI3_04735 [Hansschlegelia quercus]|uniref:Uncharacterized protein n=1 Tax=Hansschlegelia quercus TaxID=2528245 RepID=A0A4Q9GLQ5_9HYPH|nr:hypothetical protein [Hansschlegelia quercus]TBN55182.1 hypothetical protein EYR15_03330 [Hansschlegelia quercus]